MNRGTKTLLVWIVLIAAVLSILYYRGGEQDQKPATVVSAEQALAAIQDGSASAFEMEFEHLVLHTPSGRLVVKAPVPDTLWESVSQAELPYVAPIDAGVTSIVAAFLPWIVFGVLLVAVVIYFFRRFGGGGQLNVFMDMRKTKARPVGDSDKARFSDIGGNKEAVQLLADIVDFLRDPKRWETLGVRVPRGVLVVGPPGTGKTLLARAAAGETQSAFFYTSAAEFVEMFVGVGAARVRDTFEKAAAQQPAIIFIDELDAIGRRRGSGAGVIHEEREQTLNQLLVMLDGLEKYPQLVVMASTNRPDVLDPALLRSGRFDRMIRLEPPTLSERVEILKIHTRNKPVDSSVLFEELAGRTHGFTGADLETLTNEAALNAIRRCRGKLNGEMLAIAKEDFDQALAAMTKSNRVFDRLDAVLVESVSQFSEPTGRAVARITMTNGSTVEGDVVWMNAAHIKLRTADGSEVIVAKEKAMHIVPLEGTESALERDLLPDRWAGQDFGAG